MPELLDLAQKVVGWARDGEQVEAYVSRTSSTRVRVYERDIESFSSAQSEGVGVRVIANGRQGLAYATVLDEGSLKDTLEEARDNAEFGSPDEFFGLAEPDGVAAAPVDLWRDDLAAVSADRKIELALDLERRTLDGDPRIRTVTNAAWGDSLSEAALASTTGIAVTHRRTGCSVSVGAIAEENGDSQTGGGFSIGRGFADLDLDRPVVDAVHRSTRLLGSRQPASARLTIVLEPQVTQSLLSILAGTLNGESVLKGRSLFAGRVGEQVAPSFLGLVDDATNPDAFGASTHDGEGLACRPIALIEGGVLNGYLYNTYAARRAGTTSTASAVRGFGSSPGIGARAVSLTPGDTSPEDIVAGLDNAVIVDSFKGLHSGVNPISGDFSVGCTGLMVRNGAIAEPIREATIASTIQRLLQNIVVVGNDIEWTAGSAAGVTVAIADVSLGGS